MPFLEEITRYIYNYFFLLVFDPSEKKIKIKGNERMHYVELLSSGKLSPSGGEFWTFPDLREVNIFDRSHVHAFFIRDISDIKGGIIRIV